MNDMMELARKITDREAVSGKQPERFEAFIQSLPKAEIHIHVESLITPADLLKLNEKYGLYPDCRTEEELKEALGIKKIANLSEMIEQFLTIQSFIKSAEDFSVIGDSILPYMRRNNIYYLEGHLAVSSFVKRGFDFNTMMASLDRSLEEIARNEGRETAILVDVSRTFGPENAMNNLNLLLEYLSGVENSRVLGIGLGGAEKSGEPEFYKEVFDKAREAGLRCVAHGGEESPYTQIYDTLNYLKPERIGHGISAFQNEDLMKELAASRIPLEVCPTSNLLTKTFAATMEEHPIATLIEKGIMVTLNTDDPLLFDVELNREYAGVYSHTTLGFDDMITLLLNTVEATFMAPEAKKSFLDRLTKEITEKLRDFE
ncbi:MAG: adenosine deaminase [Spirochaetales bacterium]|nr:adenosine deaminase [Spirochaetales bacterium]